MMVDGGMSINDLVLQSQADFSNAKIVRKKEQEVTGLGAAIVAGLKVGIWNSLDEAREKLEVQREFEPELNAEKREKKQKRWKQAVQRSLNFGWED